ncbi:hypothetical protein HX824_10525 [Pseudomonas sp. D4002]|uniref:hypothetical protein n=1 Tax=Pseudomonas sp. D4002 TaxID=2738817 RepID=UPI0015A129F9|nr:hypothetical protein [Pseudomonas sp. D4002]NWB21035.1 hypothetical protein [Pseudomonas sp. D4002]
MNNSEQYKISLENAWRFFQLHAQQRMTVFNFYLIITGLVAAGIGACVTQEDTLSFAGGALGTFLSLVSFIFWKLDQRVSVMIKKSEDVIVQIESTFALPIESIFSEDHTQLNRNILLLHSPWTYGRCFRISFLTVGLIGIFFAIRNFAPHLDLHGIASSLTHCLKGQ